MRELNTIETNEVSAGINACETTSVDEGIKAGAAIGAALGGVAGSVVGGGLGASFLVGWNIGVYLNSLMGKCD